jgi:hypothetical protein
LSFTRLADGQSALNAEEAGPRRRIRASTGDDLGLSPMNVDTKRFLEGRGLIEGAISSPGAFGVERASAGPRGCQG